jgi:hypothetical protein
MLLKRLIPYGLGTFALLGVGGAWKEAGRSCMVGVTGTEASVTVSGWHAVDACQAIVKSEPTTYYLRETPPTEGVLCEMSSHGRRYIVRDRGLVMVVGRVICSALARQE